MSAPVLNAASHARTETIIIAVRYAIPQPILIQIIDAIAGIPVAGFPPYALQPCSPVHVKHVTSLHNPNNNQQISGNEHAEEEYRQRANRSRPPRSPIIMPCIRIGICNPAPEQHERKEHNDSGENFNAIHIHHLINLAIHSNKSNGVHQIDYLQYNRYWRFVFSISIEYIHDSCYIIQHKTINVNIITSNSLQCGIYALINTDRYFIIIVNISHFSTNHTFPCPLEQLYSGTNCNAPKTLNAYGPR